MGLVRGVKMLTFVYKLSETNFTVCRINYYFWKIPQKFRKLFLPNFTLLCFLKASVNGLTLSGSVEM